MAFHLTARLSRIMSYFMTQMLFNDFLESEFLQSLNINTRLISQRFI